MSHLQCYIFFFFRGKTFLKKGETRLFFNTTPKYGAIALVGLGKDNLDEKDFNDGFDPKKENIRVATASNTVTNITNFDFHCNFNFYFRWLP